MTARTPLSIEYKIKELFVEKNMSMRKIAKQLGMTSGCVKNCLVRQGVDVKSIVSKYRKSYEDINNWDEIIEFWENNRGSENAVYKKYGIYTGFLQRYLRESGLSYNDRGYKRLKHISDEEISRILEDYLNGLEVPTILKKYKISITNFKSIQKKFNEHRGNFRVPQQDLPELRKYSKKVRRLSKIIRKYHDKDDIPAGYHWNHMVSIIDCFKNKIPVEIASSMFNQELVKANVNLSQGYKSKITPAELFKSIQQQG